MKHEQLTGQVIRAFYNVYNTLGYGFLEKVYRNAMLIELRAMGLNAHYNQAIKVIYKGSLVGDYFADIVVENTLIVELKAGEALNPAHEAQLLNYLRATEMEIGLLFNFGPKAEFRRKFFASSHKPSNL